MNSAQPPNTSDHAYGYPLGPADVLLVTGGGKGIAAKCALAVLGRARPEQDKTLAENLARFAAAGVRCAYVSADVTDETAVRAAEAEAEGKLGKITGFLHGAGTNTPQLISTLDEAAFQRTLAPKLTGAELPLRRIRDRKRVHYPGVELIVEAEFSVENDPYLNEHALHKQKLLPAIMGLEAMAQAAMTLTDSILPPRFENVELARLVSVSDRTVRGVQ